MPKLLLRCSCGSVKGTTNDISPKFGNRIICYCNDCQAFPAHIGVADSVLDEYGGTDIFQLPVSHIKITEGSEHIRCLRLTQKGLYRWYTECCKTPIGNTLNAKMPFIGVIHSFIDSENKDKELGPVYGGYQIKSAKDGFTINPEWHSEFRTALRVFSKLLIWKIKGYNKPSAFFFDDGKAIIKPRVVGSKD